MKETLLKDYVANEVKELKKVIDKLRLAEWNNRSEILKAVNSFESKVVESSKEETINMITLSAYKSYTYELKLQLQLMLVALRSFSTEKLNKALINLTVKSHLIPTEGTKENEYIELLNETVTQAFSMAVNEGAQLKTNIRSASDFLGNMYEDLILNKYNQTFCLSRKVAVVTLFNSMGVEINNNVKETSHKYSNLTPVQLEVLLN